jgi:hypothetical protein
MVKRKRFLSPQDLCFSHQKIALASPHSGAPARVHEKMRIFLSLAILLLSLLSSSGTLSAITLKLPPLTAPGHPGWQEKRFVGRTEYRAVRENDREMLSATSHGAASGLFHEQKIDLRRTPVLHWTWTVTVTMERLDESRKSGDDFAARVYVVAKGGLAFWRTRALSYVWSGSRPVGTMWASSYTANAVLIAAQSGRERLGTVIDEKHNIRQDWQRAFGEDITTIDAVAIMTDSDNSGQSAAALYSTPWFSDT